MKRWLGFLVPVIIVLLLTSFGTPGFFKNQVNVPPFLFTVNEELIYDVADGPDRETRAQWVVLGKSSIGFREALGFKESQGKYDTINTLGYLGKYQFGKNTLQLLGVDNTSAFLKSAELQERAFESNIARNKWILRRDIKRFVGKRINGTLVTESGIVAAAHLAGAGNVKKYLRSYGQQDFSDAYGSSIAVYLKKFAGYDLSRIKQLKNAKV